MMETCCTESDGDPEVSGEVWDGNPEIYVMNSDGIEPRRLTFRSAVDGSPSLSSSKIAFDSNRDGNYEIYTMNASPEGPTNVPRRLTNNSAVDGSPSLSPGGNRICFQSDGNGNFEVYSMDLELKRLTSNSAFDGLPG